MNCNVRARSAVVLCTVAIAGCGGRATSIAPLPAVSASVPGGGSPSNAGSTPFTYGARMLDGASRSGAANVGVVGVDVALRLRDAAGLARYATLVSDPAAASYRKFLTPAEIGARFGASTADVTTVAAYFAAYGLHVGTWPQRLSLYVSGPQRDVERAFGTTLATYRSGALTFVAPASPPHVARVLPVTGVTRLVSASRAFRTLVPISGGAAVSSGYSPQQIRNAFDYTGAYGLGLTGAGISVGIVGTGPISEADVPAFGNAFHTAVAPVAQVDVTDQGVRTPGIEHPADTGFQTPPPVTAPCAGTLPVCNPEDVEAQVDTEAAASLAPGSNVLFYLGYSTAFCSDGNGNLSAAPCAPGTTISPLIGLSLADDEIQQAIADDRADVLSLSYGGPESLQAGYEFDPNDPTSGLGPAEFAALAAEGISVFVSSGDRGAEGCQGFRVATSVDAPCVSYPATDPHVTSVGGVDAPLTTFGVLTNQIIGWGLATDGGNGGSGGGVSQYFSQTLTPWQRGMPGVTGSNRNVPDASLLGDPRTGMAVLIDAAFKEQVGSVGGTSVAAPEMAAMWALVLQACSRSVTCATATGAKPYRLGNPAPLMYALYARGGTILPTYAQTFYDVVYGDNAQAPANPSPTSPPFDPGSTAMTGYDRVTGLGVPFGRALVRAVTHQ